MKKEKSVKMVCKVCKLEMWSGDIERHTKATGHKDIVPKD